MMSQRSSFDDSLPTHPTQFFKFVHELNSTAAWEAITKLSGEANLKQKGYNPGYNQGYQTPWRGRGGGRGSPRGNSSRGQRGRGYQGGSTPAASTTEH